MKTKKTALHLLNFIAILMIAISSEFANAETNKYKWRLTFEDNFNTFDRSKWITLHDNGNRTIWSNKELQWYKDENVIAENGILKLIAKQESIYGKDVESEKQFGFTSGMICGSKFFTQKYGKWKMRVRFPFKKGFWPAFFLVPIQRPTLPEIDVVEYFGINENMISCTHHWGKDYGLPAPDYNVKTKEIEGDFSDVWMVWTFECFPDKMVWKLNNKKVFESKIGVPDVPLYVIANVAIKSYEQNNNQVDVSGLPYVMEIDYIKIYELVQ